MWCAWMNTCEWCVFEILQWNISYKEEWNNAIYNMDGSRDYHT